MAYSNLIREEELKNKIASDFFSSYDTTQILGDVDFCVAQPIGNGSTEAQYFLWAEAKKGNKSILEESITQLILTIGKARTFEKHLPPHRLLEPLTHRKLLLFHTILFMKFSTRMTLIGMSHHRIIQQKNFLLFLIL